MIFWSSAAASSRQKTTSNSSTLGVAAIYGPGTNIPTAASEMLEMIRRKTAGSNV